MSSEKYLPLTEEEFNRLEGELNLIKAFLPENQMHYIWLMYNKIRDKSETQPCSCKSSAKLWASAVNALRDFVKERKSE